MIDVDQWLEQWVEGHLSASGRVDAKAEMHDLAKACAEEAKAAGITIAEIKQAADGDLETYLAGRQNVLTTRSQT